MTPNTPTPDDLRDPQMRDALEQAATQFSTDDNAALTHLRTTRERHHRRQRLTAGAAGLLATAAVIALLLMVFRPGGDPSADLQPGNGAGVPGTDWIFFSAAMGDDYDGGNVSHLYAVHPDGSGLRQITDSDTFDTGASVSPDGTRVVYRSSALDSSGRDRGGIYLTDLEGSQPERIVPGGISSAPVWSPDGSTIAFSMNGPGRDEINLATFDMAKRELTWVTRDPEQWDWMVWTPEADALVAVHDVRQPGNTDDMATPTFVERVPLSDPSASTILARPPQVTMDGEGWTLTSSRPISPDGGRALAVSWESPRTDPEQEVFWIVDLATGERTQLPLDDGYWPVGWSPDSSSVLLSGPGDDADHEGIWTVETDGTDLTKVIGNIRPQANGAGIFPTWSFVPLGAAPASPASEGQTPDGSASATYDETRDLAGTELARALGLTPTPYEGEQIPREIYAACPDHGWVIGDPSDSVAYCTFEATEDPVEGWDIAERIAGRTPSLKELEEMRDELNNSTAIPTVAKVRCIDGKTEVLTPTVFAQADGVHVQVEAIGEADNLMARSVDDGVGFSESAGSRGLEDELVFTTPAGIAEVDCQTLVEDSPDAPTTGRDIGEWEELLIVDARGDERAFIPYRPECEGKFVSFPARRMSEIFGIDATDIVEPAGYTREEGSTHWVRVVRDGRIVAALWLRDFRGEEVITKGFACPESGVGPSVI